MAETLPAKTRGLGLAITYSVYYVGSLLCAGVTYGTASIDGSWSWRLPCLLQAVFSGSCALILLFVPESPRWLAYHGYNEEALMVLASTHADGDRDAPVVRLQHQEILDTLAFERSEGQKLSYKQMFRTKNSRKRLLLCLSVAFIGMMSGTF